MLTPEQARFVSGYQQPVRPLAPVPSAPVAVVADSGRQTSAVAREAFGFVQISVQAGLVLEAMRIAHKAGVADLTGQELRKWYQRINVGKDIDTGPLAGRLNELVTARRIEKLPRRLCTVSRKPAAPHRIVAQQARLAA